MSVSFNSFSNPYYVSKNNVKQKTSKSVPSEQTNSQTTQALQELKTLGSMLINPMNIPLHGILQSLQGEPTIYEEFIGDIVGTANEKKLVEKLQKNESEILKKGTSHLEELNKAFANFDIPAEKAKAEKVLKRALYLEKTLADNSSKNFIDEKTGHSIVSKDYGRADIQEYDGNTVLREIYRNQRGGLFVKEYDPNTSKQTVYEFTANSQMNGEYNLKSIGYSGESVFAFSKNSTLVGIDEQVPTLVKNEYKMRFDKMLIFNRNQVSILEDVNQNVYGDTSAKRTYTDNGTDKEISYKVKKPNSSNTETITYSYDLNSLRQYKETINKQFPFVTTYNFKNDKLVSAEITDGSKTLFEHNYKN